MTSLESRQIGTLMCAVLIWLIRCLANILWKSINQREKTYAIGQQSMLAVWK